MLYVGQHMYTEYCTVVYTLRGTDGRILPGEPL